MMTIKLIVTFSTLIIGTFITRKELKALFSAITEKEYVELDMLHSIMAKNPSPL